jgi:hypothetical protein
MRTREPFAATVNHTSGAKMCNVLAAIASLYIERKTAKSMCLREPRVPQRGKYTMRRANREFPVSAVLPRIALAPVTFT